VTRTFVEFGVENGLENNTLRLLLEGWSGLWIEGDENCASQIRAKFREVISAGRYVLVGCGIAGVNAFFVRNNLVGSKFHEPFTAENHYQPVRYFLWQTFVSGHAPDWGPYDVV
jgi:hypothetical protein